MTFGKLHRKCHGLANKVRTCWREEKCHRRVSPLSHTCQPGRIKICHITGDRKLCARMASMGVYPGIEAELICTENGSQCILKVGGGTLSLDMSISDNILVSAI